MTEYQIIEQTPTEKKKDFELIKEKNFLQYIGSKRKLLSKITSYIEGELIVDLMAGTHSLGFFLKDKKQILANDVMKYSYIIGKAILESSILELEPLDIKSNSNYTFFQDHYSGTYFTQEQCQDFDALKFSIESLKNKHLKACYYSCVFNIMDRVGTTAGHFDGFLKKSTQKAQRRKNKKVLKYFQKEVKQFKNKKNKYDSEVYNLKDTDFLKQIEKVDTIYIDPPYNHRQYSTLYHIPEMFVRYSGELKDCLYQYPKDRYFSPYCYKTKAKTAFDELIELSARKTDHVVFSYSNKGLVPVKALMKIFKKHFKTLKKMEIPYYHRQQKTSRGSGMVKELIFSMHN